MRRWLVAPLVIAIAASAGCSRSDVPVAVPAATDASGSSSIATSTEVVPDGYDLVQATITGADGTECEVCLWLAATDDQRRSGLMFVTDLGAGDGMAFRYPSPHTGSFWMKNTVLPLSIAFFDPDGEYLDAFDMEPCTTNDCPTYATPPSFLVAIETTQGDLPDLGIGPGSTLELTDLPCE